MTEDAAILAAICSAGIGIAVTDRDGRVLHSNPIFLQHTELEHVADTGRRAWFYLDHASDETQAERAALWSRFVRDSTRWQGMVRWQLTNGQIRYFEGTAISQPASEKVILITNDRTDRIEAKRHITETEQVRDQVLNALPLFLCVTDATYQVTYLNSFLPDRLGKPVEAFVGRRVERIYGASLKATAEQLIDQVFNDGTSTRTQMVEVDFLGGTHWLVQAHPLHDRMGNVTRVLTTALDRTDSVRLRNERIKFADAIHESQKIEAINDFAGGLAHELSNLLQPIAGYARLLAVQPVNDTHRDYAAKINQAALAAGRILKRTLTMSRIDSGGPLTSNVTSTVSETVETARDLAPALLQYELETAPDLIGACPAGELRQVLLNVLNNAAEAMHYRGHIRISATGGHEFPQHVDLLPTGNAPFLCIRIEDDGPGIPEAIRARIFEPFFTTKPVGRGTGLGLAVVQGLVMGWGGIVSVDARQPAGSVFDVWIPAANPS